MAFALQKEGNDRMNFICDEDIGHTSKPSFWTQVFALLKEDYANSMVLRVFAEVIGLRKNRLIRFKSSAFEVFFRSKYMYVALE